MCAGPSMKDNQSCWTVPFQMPCTPAEHQTGVSIPQLSNTCSTVIILSTPTLSEIVMFSMDKFTKPCGLCKLEKPLTDFNRQTKSKDGRQPWCRSCGKERGLANYYANQAHHYAVAQARTQRIKDFLDWLRTLPCYDCHVSYPPYVMDFDHREGEEKIAPISWLRKSRAAQETLLNEIPKCDIVCSNCHRQRTHSRGYPNTPTPINPHKRSHNQKATAQHSRARANHLEQREHQKIAKREAYTSEIAGLNL